MMMIYIMTNFFKQEKKWTRSIYYTFAGKQFKNHMKYGNWYLRIWLHWSDSERVLSRIRRSTLLVTGSKIRGQESPLIRREALLSSIRTRKSAWRWTKGTSATPSIRPMQTSELMHTSEDPSQRLRRRWTRSFPGLTRSKLTWGSLGKWFLLFRDTEKLAVSLNLV